MSVSFHELLAGLGARPSGDQWCACCPAHDDRHPSLTVAQRDGRLLIYCHRGCDFWDIVAALERRGLWPVDTGQPYAAVDPHNAGKAAELHQRLHKINEEGQPLDRTRADRYLNNRRITLRNGGELGYHPSLFHPWSRTTWPALIAVVRNVENWFVGFHRTWLTFGEPVTKAPIDPVRAMLGPLSGHAVHLSPPATKLLVGEGIETVLSAIQLFGLPGWAALSAVNLPTVQLPLSVRDVVIAADNDDAGIAAAAAAAKRFRHQGRRVRIERPPAGYNDFNDVLRGGD